MEHSLHSQFVVGTFFLQGRSAKILGTELLAKHWRHAAFCSQRGGAKIIVDSLHSRFVVGTLFLPRVVRENFHQIDKHAPTALGNIWGHCVALVQLGPLVAPVRSMLPWKEMFLSISYTCDTGDGIFGISSGGGSFMWIPARDGIFMTSAGGGSFMSGLLGPQPACPRGEFRREMALCFVCQ